jgi:hypothetical protein
MNLIEELGLEKCKQIVDGAPKGSEMWRDMDSVCSPGEFLYYSWFGGALLVHDPEKGWFKSIYHDGNEYILDQLEGLKDLRAALADHDRTDYVSDIRNHIAPTTVVIER